MPADRPAPRHRAQLHAASAAALAIWLLAAPSALADEPAEGGESAEKTGGATVADATAIGSHDREDSGPGAPEVTRPDPASGESGTSGGSSHSGSSRDSGDSGDAGGSGDSTGSGHSGNPDEAAAATPQEQAGGTTEPGSRHESGSQTSPDAAHTPEPADDSAHAPRPQADPGEVADEPGAASPTTPSAGDPSPDESASGGSGSPGNSGGADGSGSSGHSTGSTSSGHSGNPGEPAAATPQEQNDAGTSAHPHPGSTTAQGSQHESGSQTSPDPAGEPGTASPTTPSAGNPAQETVPAVPGTGAGHPGEPDAPGAGMPAAEETATPPATAHTSSGETLARQGAEGTARDGEAAQPGELAGPGTTGGPGAPGAAGAGEAGAAARLSAADGLPGDGSSPAMQAPPSGSPALSRDRVEWSWQLLTGLTGDLGSERTPLGIPSPRVTGPDTPASAALRPGTARQAPERPHLALSGSSAQPGTPAQEDAGSDDSPADRGTATTTADAPRQEPPRSPSARTQDPASASPSGMRPGGTEDPGTDASHTPGGANRPGGSARTTPRSPASGTARPGRSGATGGTGPAPASTASPTGPAGGTIGTGSGAQAPTGTVPGITHSAGGTSAPGTAPGTTGSAAGARQHAPGPRVAGPFTPAPSRPPAAAAAPAGPGATPRPAYPITPAAGSAITWDSGVAPASAQQQDTRHVASLARDRNSPVSAAAVRLTPQTWDELRSTGEVRSALRGSLKRKVIRAPLIPATGASLQACAKGTYRAHWEAFARSLAADGISAPTLDLGHDPDGKADPAAYAACYRQVAAAVRGVLPRVQLQWTVTRGTTATSPVPWPGDQVVDIIGIESFDTGSDWSRAVNGERGLNWWAAFAREHDARIAITAWGPVPGSAASAANAAYIQNMRDWMGRTARTGALAYDLYSESSSAAGGQAARSYRVLF